MEKIIITFCICILIIIAIIMKWNPFIIKPAKYEFEPYWYCTQNYSEVKHSDIPWKCINYMQKY